MVEDAIYESLLLESSALGMQSTKKLRQLSELESMRAYAYLLMLALV